MSNDFDESRVRRGQPQNAGQFAAKTTGAPSGALTIAQVAHFSTAPDRETRRLYARTPDFAAGALAAHLEEDDGVSVETAAAADGGIDMRWAHENPYGGDSWLYRAHVDSDGNLTTVEGYTGHEDVWAEDEDRFVDLSVELNAERLRAMGAQIDGSSADPGYSGNKWVGGAAPKNGGWVNATDVAKNTRAQLKDAVAWGALPGEYKYRVTSSKASMTQSVNVFIEGVPDEKNLVTNPNGFLKSHPHSAILSKTARMIVDQWNTDDTDSQRDYFSVSYYSHVSVETESDVKFTQQQREIQLRKREAAAARKAALS